MSGCIYSEILANMCNEIVCKPGFDAMNFEVEPYLPNQAGFPT